MPPPLDGKEGDGRGIVLRKLPFLVQFGDWGRRTLDVNLLGQLESPNAVFSAHGGVS